MSKEYNESGNRQFWSTFSGSFRRRAKHTDEPSEIITRINKNDKEVKEVARTALGGNITNIYFEPSEYGEQLKIELDANEAGQVPILGFGVESKDGRDLMKKLPALDLSKEVKFVPYQFVDEDDKRSGVTLYQSENGEFDKKIANHFWNEEKKEFINGFPTIDWDNATEKERKIWKIERDTFLKTYLLEHVCSKFPDGIRSEVELKRPQRVKGEDPAKDIDDAFDAAFPDKPPF